MRGSASAGGVTHNAAGRIHEVRCASGSSESSGDEETGGGSVTDDGIGDGSTGRQVDEPRVRTNTGRRSPAVHSSTDARGAARAAPPGTRRGLRATQAGDASSMHHGRDRAGDGDEERRRLFLKACRVASDVARQVAHRTRTADSRGGLTRHDVVTGALAVIKRCAGPHKHTVLYPEAAHDAGLGGRGASGAAAAPAVSDDECVEVLAHLQPCYDSIEPARSSLTSPISVPWVLALVDSGYGMAVGRGVSAGVGVPSSTGRGGDSAGHSRLDALSLAVMRGAEAVVLHVTELVAAW